MQVVEGSDSGQKPDVASTDSDGPVETHVSNPPQLQKLYTKEPKNDLGTRQVHTYMYRAVATGPVCRFQPDRFPGHQAHGALRASWRATHPRSAVPYYTRLARANAIAFSLDT